MGTSMEHLLPLDASRLLTTSETSPLCCTENGIYTYEAKVLFLVESAGWQNYLDSLKFILSIFFHCLLSTS